MKRIIAFAATALLGLATAGAQSLEDLNVQIHGYATQGFLYTTNNNAFTTMSSDGSPAWTEAVANIGAQPTPKLRISVQARYFLLGNFGNTITVDYASADYKVNDRFGVRFGKVKIPSGLFNEIQDIDPGYQWALLPQGIYPITSRNGQLSLYGGAIYGTIDLLPKLGKMEYRAWSGENALPSNDGYFLPFAEAGLAIPNGTTQIENGGALHWRTPLSGLMVGASDSRKNTASSQLTAGGGALQGQFVLNHFHSPNIFAKYEKNRLMVAAEWGRDCVSFRFQFAGPPAVNQPIDERALYGMATYKLTDRLTAGVYNSQSFNHSAPLGPARYSKDWTISGRYDFNQFLYAKVEQHFVEGTNQDYDATLNPGGLKPNSKFTVLKVGVSF